MSLYLLDTNTVSYIVKGKSPAARARLASLGVPDLAVISAVTEAEIQYGLAKTPGGGERWRAAMGAFLARLQVLPWGRDEALAYGTLRANLEAAGQTLGSMDMMIAAHAIGADAVLVTSDKAFTRISALRAVENWATDL